MEKLEYTDNVINLIVKDNLINSLEDVINDLREEEYFDEDVYEYINRRTKRGTITHLKNGKPIGRVRYGYKKDDNKQWVIYDKIKLNKKPYWDYVNNGGVKKDWKKEWSVGRGVRETSLKQLVTKQSNICLNNRNFLLNLHLEWSMV